ncbi:MAG: protein translocase subunit SecF, partial [Clostridia bacterium]|nr:protein translocase subunit SecF [Clostridia bacterium]
MFDFIKNRKIWYIISGIIILVGIVSLCVQGLNWGIDFTGGSETIVKFAEPVDISMVREAVDSTGISNSVNGVADAAAAAKADQENNFTTFVISTRDLQQSEELDEAVILSDALSAVGENEQLSQQTVGSVIGKELTRNAILALLLAMVLMVVYISFRFEFKQGLATIFALIYDVLVVISAF